MSLDIWQKKIQEKRKKTPLKEFLLEIPSWFPVVLWKNNGFISRFPQSWRVTITSKKNFDDLRDTLWEYWKEFESGTDFFQQFQTLFQKVPLPNLLQYGESENIEYADNSWNSKNAYLSSTVIYNSENVFYTIWALSSKNVFNSLQVIRNSEIVHFWKWVKESFKIFYSNFITNSSNIWFSSNLIWCSECLFCDNLINTSFAIENKIYEKDIYFVKKEELLKQKDMFDSWYLKVSSQWTSFNNVQCSWNYIIESENIANGVFVANAKNGRNVMFSWWNAEIEEFYDCFSTGGGGKSNYFWVTQWGGGEHNYCSVWVLFCNSIFYSFYLESCSFCLWCVGLQNKSFCIFNKQYSKEDWFKKVDEIFSQMEKENTLWNFFPWYINPYYFNDTIAWFFGLFSREETEKKWYLYREESITIATPQNSEIIPLETIWNYEWFENGVWKIHRDICKKIIQDQEGNLFTFLPEEVDFYEKYGLSLPKNHWKNRIKHHLEHIDFLT